MRALMQTISDWVGLRARPDRPCLMRPDWVRLEADHDYFCSILAQLFEHNGYQVLELRAHHSPAEETARACGFVLQRGGRRHVGLGLRQNMVVTSDVVAHLGRARRSAGAEAGLLITTSFFTKAALDAALGSPIYLYDRCQLWDLLALA